jgi:hypothetical protein
MAGEETTQPMLDKERLAYDETPDGPAPDVNDGPALQTSRLLFDRRDTDLINIISAVIRQDHDLSYARKQYYGYFHPHGIKEMAESRSLRIAYAMVHLLTSLEMGRMDERLGALRSLKDELLDTAEGSLPKNTARVLLQIMKELVRARGDYYRQLKLAHDFRITASGRPRSVRKQLLRYHLLEMPEEWNQVTFDDHVHDVNTKGRKSSTHLIMDAWIKGIRRLRVVYYNYIEPRFAAELLEAAEILDIDVRIGIEFPARFHERFIQLIWTPRGFADAQAFLCFLEEPAVSRLMREGRLLSRYQQAYVTALLEAFNQTHREHLRREHDIDLEPVDIKDFMNFVGTGQRSILHLKKFIQQKIFAALHVKAGRLRERYPAADGQEREAIEGWFEKWNGLDLETLVGQYLKPSNNPDIPNPMVPGQSDKTLSELILSPKALLDRLAGLQSGYRVTLNLTGLRPEDVLELLYDCDGMISRLEIFNLKDWASAKTEHIEAISRLQEAVNEQNPIAMKRIILEFIAAVEDRHKGRRTPSERVEKLTYILHDIIGLLSFYKDKPLKARIGTDSTGQTLRIHGMGLAVIDSLTRRALRRIRRDIGVGRAMIPMRIPVHKRITLVPRKEANSRHRSAHRLSAWLPGLRHLGHDRIVDWAVQGDASSMTPHGNIVTLGGVQKTVDNQLRLEPSNPASRRPRLSWTYLNSDLRNCIKVLVGFIPAFATFALTKDWWLLAYCGAFIWFGITGLRNILQSVLGGGGLRRSPFLRWNAYVSWDRIADSLLFTGFSVPLLDFLTKTVILDRIFGITTATQPVALYTFMALTNGVYLSSHNAFRGLPRGAVLGNFFRSVLSIPIAILFNIVLGGLLSYGGVAAVDLVLQKWAAVISKAASDMVAGIIEGTADRVKNIQIRAREYRKKLTALLDIYTQLELLFPESRTLEILDKPTEYQKRVHAEAQDLERIIMIHALDLLYFWLYQPRARSAFEQLLGTLNEEERHILITAQSTLLRKREISQMFIDGVLGQDFARALSFYLSCYPDYLKTLQQFT